MGPEGRRIDAIVWGDDWEVDRSFQAFSAGQEMEGEKDQDEGDEKWLELKRKVIAGASAGAGAGAGVGAGIEPLPKQTPKQTQWTYEQFKFHLITALLPSLLKSPSDRSVRLISLVGPFYAAAIPTFSSSTFSETDSTTSTSTSKAKKEKQPDGLKTKSSGLKIKMTTLESPILSSGSKSLRSITLWKHLGLILDALATASQGSKVIPTPTPDQSQAQGQDQSQARGQGPASASATATETEIKMDNKTVSTESHIVALTVVMGFERRGILKPLLGLGRKSRRGSSAMGFYL